MKLGVKLIVSILSLFCVTSLISSQNTFSTTKAIEKDTFFVPMRPGENKRITFEFTNISRKQSKIFIRFLSIEFPKGEKEKWNTSICTIQLWPTQGGQETDPVRPGRSIPIDLCVSAQKDVGLNQLAKIVLELQPSVNKTLKTTLTFYMICLAPKEIHLTIGQDSATIKNGRMLVPLRFIGDNLGAETKWEPKTQLISFLLSVMELTFQIGKKEMQTKIGPGYTKTSSIEVAPILLSNRTFVPLRVVAENLGATVLYDSATRQITIHFPPLPNNGN